MSVSLIFLVIFIILFSKPTWHYYFKPIIIMLLTQPHNYNFTVAPKSQYFTLFLYNNNNRTKRKLQHYYLDVWIKTFVWFRFTIIIISDFSERDFYLDALISKILWSRNHVTYFHFGIPTGEKLRGRLLETICIFLCVQWNMNIGTIRLCWNRCSVSMLFLLWQGEIEREFHVEGGGGLFFTSAR